ADDAQVGPEVAQGGEVSGRPQDGWQEDQEHHVGIEADHRHLRERAQGEAAHHEEDGVGKEEVARQRGQDEHGHEQDDGGLEILDAGDFLDAERSKAWRGSGDEEGVERKWTRVSARRGRRGGSPPPPGAEDRAPWRDAWYSALRVAPPSTHRQDT